MSVTLHTPTGVVAYRLPVALADTFDSSEVSDVLGSGGGYGIAQRDRRSHRLLGVIIARRVRYPRFQFDLVRRELRSVCVYANQRLQCYSDPWGSLDWWYELDLSLGGRPVDLLEAGTLTEHGIELAITLAEQGMD